MRPPGGLEISPFFGGALLLPGEFTADLTYIAIKWRRLAAFVKWLRSFCVMPIFQNFDTRLRFEKPCMEQCLARLLSTFHCDGIVERVAIVADIAINIPSS